MKKTCVESEFKFYFNNFIISLLISHERGIAMPRPFRGEEVVAEALEVLTTTKSLEQFRQAQAVVLPLRHGLSLKETAQALGLTPRWVSQLRNRFIVGQRVSETPRCGGRHHAYLSPEKETELLHPFIGEAAHGGVVVVGQIKARLEAKLNRSVALSSVYALLHRHGWRRPVSDKLPGG
jgi:transposase